MFQRVINRIKVAFKWLIKSAYIALTLIVAWYGLFLYASDIAGFFKLTFSQMVSPWEHWYQNMVYFGVLQAAVAMVLVVIMAMVALWKHSQTQVPVLKPSTQKRGVEHAG